MTLRPVHDISAADWLTEHPQPWPRLALFGPSVFGAYARLRFIPEVERDPGEARDMPRARPAFPPGVLGPRVRHPHRSYFLFQGPVSDLGDWGAADVAPGIRRQELAPAFVWPADHAWCLAADVDPHWAGIGGSDELIDALLRISDLDIVEADPWEPQPFYT